MEFWIARDDFTSTQHNRVGDLYLYLKEPKRVVNRFIEEYYIPLDDKLFPEVTFENSPRKVKIELI